MASYGDVIFGNESDSEADCENANEEKQKISPNARRKLWMKTPFASFSSTSSVSINGFKNNEAIQNLRSKLQDLKLQEIKADGNFKKKHQGIYNRIFCCESSTRYNNNKKKSLEGPLRVVRLLVFAIIIPGILVGVPLYMRFYMYGEQAYPVGMSDMRLLDHRVSTTWCQSQTVWSNATFNAYLMGSSPQIEREHEVVSMTRDLNNLEDDMKEYWGFYLLKGSVITVSTCARFPGASLILIRGHKHLRDCAYIGDDSSEELDELYPEDRNDTENNDPANKPAQMTKMSDGIVVHGQVKTKNNTDKLASYHSQTSESESDSTGKQEKVKKIERNDLKVGDKVHLAYAELGNKLAKFHVDMGKLKANLLENKTPKKNVKVNSKINNEPVNTATTNPPVLSSREIYEDVLKKLNVLGDRGKKILERINNDFVNGAATTLNSSDIKVNKTVTPETESKSKHKVRHNRKIIKSDLNQPNNNTASNHSKSDDSLLRRDRREILLNSLHNPITDQEEDTAMEEEIHNPDDIAEIRGSVNETTANDKSNSEFWSSFSSSEERLMNCEGLLLNLPLVSHRYCNASISDHPHAFAPNSVTYKVTSNGYYFFIFNSENEVRPNFIRIHFRLEKTKYDLSEPVAVCRNQTSPCKLPLTFWSDQKVVLQLPVGANDALWNQEFLAISTCDPRTPIYALCVIAVPLFIIIFAFQ